MGAKVDEGIERSSGGDLPDDRRRKFPFSFSPGEGEERIGAPEPVSLRLLPAREPEGVGRGKETVKRVEAGLLKGLYDLLEEEIFHYHLLVEELKKESEHLRRGSVDSLTESLQSLEIHAATIRKIHESIQKTVGKTLALLSPGEAERGLSRLLVVLPPQDAAPIKSYQNTVDGLKIRMARINERNKTYIKESMNYWKDLVTLLTEPLAESPVYVQNGKKSVSGSLPRTLNRKV
jgi:hypothetical protein